MKTDSILAKIEKAKKSIERLNGVIAKNEAKLAKGGDRFDCECAIHIAEEDLRRRTRELAVLLEKLEAAAAEEAKKALFEAELPECLIGFRSRLVESWDAHDKAERDAIVEQGDAYWRENGGSYGDYIRAVELTDETIHDRNFRDATKMAANLIKRVEKAVGKVRSYSRLYLANGNWLEGGSALNGFVEGERGICEVRSILAGGYNIQRLHVRVLVI